MKQFARAGLALCLVTGPFGLMGVPIAHAQLGCDRWENLNGGWVMTPSKAHEFWGGQDVLLATQDGTRSVTGVMACPRGDQPCTLSFPLVRTPVPPAEDEVAGEIFAEVEVFEDGDQTYLVAVGLDQALMRAYDERYEGRLAVQPPSTGADFDSPGSVFKCTMKAAK